MSACFSLSSSYNAAIGCGNLILGIIKVAGNRLVNFIRTLQRWRQQFGTSIDNTRTIIKRVELGTILLLLSSTLIPCNLF